MKKVKMTVQIELEVLDTLKIENVKADLSALKLYYQKKKGREELGEDIKVLGYETKSVEYVPGDIPIPPQLQDILSRYNYDLHPDLLEQIKKGNLEFAHEFKELGSGLIFTIPALAERDSYVQLTWCGPDEKTWHLGEMRFFAERQHDGGGDDEAWSPENEPEDETEFSIKQAHESNVGDFISWMENEING